MRSLSVDVLHVIGSFVAGGAERFVVSLMPQLKQQGLSVCVIALSSKIDDVGRAMCELLDKEGIPFFIGPTDKVSYRSALWYVKKLYEIRPAIVHLHTPNTELAHYIGTKFYRKNHLLVRTLHSTSIPPNRWYRRALRKNVANISIACSNAVRQKCLSEIDGDILTIQNGVQFGWPVQTNTRREQYKIKLRLNCDKYHVLNIGRQSGKDLAAAPKAHDVLINAWKVGGLSVRQCDLHLIGDGTLADELKRLAENDSSICFHGVKDNVHEWLLAADCYVMPSRYEGLPIAGIEAVGTGLPCVFSDIEPLRELEWTAALWATPGNVEELAKRLIEMSEQKMQGDPDSAGRIRNRFGIQQTAKRYSACYSSLRR